MDDDNDVDVDVVVVTDDDVALSANRRLKHKKISLVEFNGTGHQMKY